jgi:rhomboid protease GluP
VIIFTVSGVVGFVVSNIVGVPFTVGASGSIFGLLGALVAYGRRRGGHFGALVLRQYGQWALLLFIMGFFMSAVNNWAHAGGFLGGFLSGFLLSFEDDRSESGADRFLAAAAILVTIAGFVLALWTALSGG